MREQTIVSLSLVLTASKMSILSQNAVEIASTSIQLEGLCRDSHGVIL